jgi:two-component system, cell cycle sensor histidine kinase PleC
MVATTGPFAFILCCVMLLKEAYPFNILFSAMALLYVLETLITAGKLSHIVGRMIDLQIGNDTLIGSLAREKAESDQARIQAERASRAKSNFLANMSHELRTPLNAILGFSEIIRDRSFGDAATAKYSNYAGDIHVSGKHLLALINDILDLSRIEAGKWELSEKDIALGSLLDQVAKLHAPMASAQSIALSVECECGPRLFADAKAVMQILVNLVTNALKFTPAGGTVCIRARLVRDCWTLEVQDTGYGISPEDIPRVLERFGQARHDVAATKNKGVGLGLPITKGLVEMHDGKLSLRSELNAGTVVTIEFPPVRTVATSSAA